MTVLGIPSTVYVSSIIFLGDTTLTSQTHSPISLTYNRRYGGKEECRLNSTKRTIGSDHLSLTGNQNLNRTKKYAQAVLVDSHYTNFILKPPIANGSRYV